MRTPTQPDLFGEADAAEARAEAWREWTANPQTCPLCGNTERTGFLLNNNHLLGYGPDSKRLYTSECTAMYLTRNHVLFWARPEVEDLTGGQLARDLRRAREVWANRLDDLRASLAEHGIDLDELTTEFGLAVEDSSYG